MTDMNDNDFNDRVDRRRRVSRIRDTLLFIIALWFFTSIAVMGILWIRVSSLQKQLNELSEGMQTTQVSESKTAESADTPEQSKSSSKNKKAKSRNNDSEATDSREDEPYDIKTAPGAYQEKMNRAMEVESAARDEDKHKIYLTFNGAPNKNTAKILDTLQDEGIQGSFFCDYAEGDEADSLYQRIVSEGHTLGMHSYTSDYDGLFDTEDTFKENFTALRDHLKSVTGVESVFYRFPGGSSNAAAVAKISMMDLCEFVVSEGAAYVDWNCDSGDSVRNDVSTAEIVENIKTHVLDYKSSIVVMNASRENTADALSDVIDSIKKADGQCVFLPITGGTDRCHFLKMDGEE